MFLFPVMRELEFWLYDEIVVFLPNTASWTFRRYYHPHFGKN